jgi:signal transduction histidine kinase/HAMP domain-containing protein
MKQRLISLMAVLVIGFGSLLGLAIATIQQVRVSGPLYETIRERAQLQHRLALLQVDLSEIRVASLTAFSATDLDALRELHRSARELSDHVTAEFKELLAMARDDDVRSALDSALLTWTEFRNTDDLIFRQRLSGRRPIPASLLEMQDLRKERFTEQVDSASNALALRSESVEQETASQVRRRVLALIAIGAGLALAVVASGFAIARSMTRRLRKVAAACVEAAEGGALQSVSIAGGDEIGSLAASFNAMTARLAAHINDLEQAEASTAAMAAIGQGLAGTLDFTQATRQVVSTAHVRFGARRTLLFQRDESSGSLLCVAAEGGEAAAGWIGCKFESDETAASLAVKRGEVVWSADVLADPRMSLPEWLRRRDESDGCRSVAAVPLIAGGEVVGSLTLSDTVGRVFNDAELKLLSAFGSHASIAIRNARLHKELRVRLTQSETLLAVSKQVTATVDSAEMMRRLAAEIGRAIGADMVGVFFADPEQGTLRPIAGYHVPKERLHDFMTHPIPLKGHRILEEAWERREPVWLSDVGADSRIDRQSFERFPHRSNLFCPIVVQERPVAGFFVTWLQEEHQFTPEEIQLVHAISRQAGVALANARLLEELRARQSRLEALLDMTRQLARLQPMPSLLSSIAEALAKLLGTDSVGIRLVEGDELVLAATAGDAAQLMRKARLKIGESFSGQVAATGELLLITDPERDARLTPDHRGALQSLGYRTWLGVPVKVHDHLVGVLSVWTKVPSGFSADDVAIVTAFGAHLAVTIENNRLYQGLQRAYDHLNQAQDQLAQAQKMEAVGRLAGGIAHDFNNLLTVISGHTYLLLQTVTSNDEARLKIELIRDTAARAAGLTRQLLAFSRKQVLLPVLLDLVSLVANVMPMLRRLVREDIELALLHGVTEATVRADQAQLEQVVTNLVVNASDTMPHGGRLTLRISTAEVDQGSAEQRPAVPAGAYVTLAVSDTGTGMPADVKARIFEPFFTTKELGKGTGLGLAIVYGIVTQHGGYITVDSEVDQGSTFTIHLPRVVRTVSQREALAPESPLPGGAETVLLVEDDPQVCALIREMLGRLGYKVLWAPNGAEAVHLASVHAEPIALLVTDVVMPRMKGPEVAEQVRHLHPEARVLYVSGYADDVLAPVGVLVSRTPLLAKPFTPEVLARKVREVLDGPAADPVIR